MVNQQPRTGGRIVRILIGGMLVVLSLPILAPLIAGAVVSRAIYGVYTLTRERGSDGSRDA